MGRAGKSGTRETPSLTREVSLVFPDMVVRTHPVLLVLVEDCVIRDVSLGNTHSTIFLSFLD